MKVGIRKDCINTCEVHSCKTTCTAYTINRLLIALDSPRAVDDIDATSSIKLLLKMVAAGTEDADPDESRRAKSYSKVSSRSVIYPYNPNNSQPLTSSDSNFGAASCRAP